MMSSILIGKYVIVRSSADEVFAGNLFSVSGRHVVLKGARMLYEWETKSGGLSLCDLASSGLPEDFRNCKLTLSVSVIEVLEASSIIEVQYKYAQRTISKAPFYKKSEEPEKKTGITYVNFDGSTHQGF